MGLFALTVSAYSCKHVRKRQYNQNYQDWCGQSIHLADYRKSVRGCDLWATHGLVLNDSLG